MRGFLGAAITAVSFLGATAAVAEPVSLGTIEHLYGADAGRQLPSIMSIYHPGGNCDAVNGASITVKATTASSCNRFGDVFDFSGIDYDSIDHFALTLTFSGAKDQKQFGLISESWSVRAGYNYTVTGVDFGTLGASGPQTFTFGGTKSNFANVLDAEAFYLFFATSQGTSMKFDLASAKLEIFGTPVVTSVPEPGSLALLSLSMIALWGVRRMRIGSAR